MAGTYSLADVAKHNSETDCWLVIDGGVYDVSKFLADHPGGKKVLLKEAGKDASAKFKMFHKEGVLEKYGASLKVGVVAGTAAPAPAKPAAAKAADSAGVAPYTGAYAKLDVRRLGEFGSTTPFGDPGSLQGQNTPFYSPSHVEWRARLRAFVEKEIAPFVNEWDEAYAVPRELYAKMYRAGFMPAAVGVPWPSEWVDVPAPAGFDHFHEMILMDEVCRPGSGGFAWAIFGGLSIGLPPVLKFGSKQLQAKVAPPCLRGEKFICLAITEPGAGSDVAGIQTTARKTADGRHYVLNGEKKWITNGVFADYFTVAARTGGEGAGGISLLLVERSMKGVATRHMKCMGVWPSGTAYVTFEDVLVPVENVIGGENNGFKCIMYNFNHERWSICCQAMRFSRVCLEESFRYAMQRRTFGKVLAEHQAIRFKLAEMARAVEATQAWLEMVTYQMCTMSHEEMNAKMGGTIALLKVQCTKTFEMCAREAAQVFGGASYVRGGVGEKIERLYREVRAYAIPGGSEEIMLDFAGRQAMRAKPASKL